MATGNVTATTAANIGAAMTYAAQETLPVLKSSLGLAKFVRRYTDEVPGVRYQSVVLPAVGSSPAREKAANTAVTFDVDEGTPAQITLDKHVYKAMRIEDFARAISNPDILAAHLQSAMVSIAERVEADVFAAARAGFTSNVGTWGTDIDIATLRLAGKRLFDNKAPNGERILAISSKDDLALRSDDSLHTYFANADAAAVREGRVAKIEGFDIFPSQLIPVTAGTPNQTANMALHREAVCVATRALEAPQDGGIVVETVSDPDLAFTFRLMHSYDHAHLGHTVTVDCLYGVSTIRPELGVIVRA